MKKALCIIVVAVLLVAGSLVGAAYLDGYRICERGVTMVNRNITFGIETCEVITEGDIYKRVRFRDTEGNEYELGFGPYSVKDVIVALMD